MLAKRIIPCLDCDLSVPQGRVVKGIRFKQIKEAGVPWLLAERYYSEGADEICFLDITASHEKRETMVRVVEKTCENVFVPVTVGGGVRKTEDFVKLLRAGADKCTVNTAALKNPSLINKAAKLVGSQCVVLAIDCIKRPVTDPNKAKNKIIVETQNGPAWYECSYYGGRKFTGKDAIAWAKEAQKRGAGEILLTSMDADGTKKGYDLDLTKKVVEETSIPIIASGGAGTVDDIAEVFKKTDASAALAASIFHYKEYSVLEVKKKLAEKGINVRL